MCLARTLPSVDGAFDKLEEVLWIQLLPTMLGRAPPGEDEWQLLSLPIRFGGLGTYSGFIKDGCSRV